MSKIKVMLTDDSLPVGGKEILLLEYLRRLDRSKFDVHLVTLTPRGQLIDQARARAGQYFCPARKTGLDIKAILRLRKYIQSHNIDLVHTNQWIDSLYVQIAAMGIRIKRVATVHGVVPGWRQTIHIAVLRQFDRVICVSQGQRNALVARGYSPDNLMVINNGIDYEKYANVTAHSAGNDSVAIGMIGNIRQEKDILTLCRAAHRLIQAGNNKFEIRLIGGVIDHKYKTSVKNYCSLNGINDYVRFLGPSDNVPGLLSQLDIYVASSRSETFGLALVEAMACGLPVIVSEIPSFMEIIDCGRYGLHFPVGNDLQLAQCLDQLIKNELLRSQYGNLARQRAGAFSIEITLMHLQSLYSQLCADDSKNIR